MNQAPHLPSVVACGEFHKTKKYEIIRPEGSGDWIIFFTLSGNGVFTSGKEKHFCHGGDVNLYQPGYLQNYRTSGESWRFIWAHFHPPENWTHWLNLPDSGMTGLLGMHVEKISLRRRIEKSLRRMLSHDRLPSYYKTPLTLNALEEALLWISEANPNLRDNHLDERIDKVLEILSSDFAEKHTVESLSRIAGLSPSRFAHLFKEQIGQSVIETLISLRLAEAAKLLEFTSDPVKTISVQTGFQNPYYFSRLFSQKYRIPPRDYRKQHFGTMLSRQKPPAKQMKPFK